MRGALNLLRKNVRRNIGRKRERERGNVLPVLHNITGEQYIKTTTLSWAI